MYNEHISKEVQLYYFRDLLACNVRRSVNRCTTLLMVT